MEGKRCLYISNSVYLSKGKHIKTYMTKFVLACRESKEVVDDHTNHRGASMVFVIRNSIHMGEDKILTMTTTHYVESLQRMPLHSNDIEEKDGEQKVSSVLG